MDVLLLYNYIISGALLLILANFLLNLYLFKDTASYYVSDYTGFSRPLVSILIPARNEEKNIRRCLRSLIRQDYPNFEILVLNDNSTDRTAQVTKEIASKHNNIKIIDGKPLPDGWLGKSFACFQLAKQAKGSYFLFTDADTLHFKSSVSSAMGAILANGLDAISVFARQITVTIHERMMVHFANYFLLSFMPFILIRHSKNPLFCTAIGQFLLFKREVYEEIGGHEAIKKEILDDIHISKQVKRHGFKFMVFDGKNNFYCRMYKNLREVIGGYSKVLSAVFDYNLILQSVVTITVFAVYLCPFVILPLSILYFGWLHMITNLLILQVLIITALKIMQTIRFKNRFSDIFLFPLSVIYLLLISIHSMLKSKSAHGILWKGRSYDVRKEDDLKLVKDSKNQDTIRG